MANAITRASVDGPLSKTAVQMKDCELVSKFSCGPIPRQTAHRLQAILICCNTCEA
ncbi:MAG: hypothetical protein QOD99_881 [Chthoniobacter sp.]|jgi:hypothetical protein|nr:hypothetical protein [Chthoniobacter sp.]